MVEENKEIRIVALLNEGKKWDEIAELEHCSNSTINKVATKNNLTKKTKPKESSSDKRTTTQEIITTTHTTTPIIVPEISKIETKLTKNHTANSLINEMISHLDPLGMLNADQKRLREILTSEAGTENRNKRWQFSVVKIALECLIEMGLIR